VHRGLVAALVAVTAFTIGGSSPQAGLYFLPPADVHAQISPDASVVVFFRTSSPYVDSRPSLYVMRPDGSGTRLLPLSTHGAFAFSRTWQWIAVADEPGSAGIVVSRPDGSDRRLVAHTSQVSPQLSFSPDESRLAYSDGDGVWTVGVDGTTSKRIGDGRDPSWSPVGDAVAFSQGGRLVVAVLDSSGDVKALRDLGLGGQTPRWSPDGSRIALAVGNRVVVVGLADGGRDTYEVHGNPLLLAWSPDSRRIAYLTAALGGVVRPARGGGLYVMAVGDRMLAHQRRLALFGVEPDVGSAALDWSPRGGWIVFSANGVCHDRVGLYRVSADSPSTPVRVTNLCRVSGTNADDRIAGTPLFDRIVGGGGDDVLSAVDDNYQGDDLYGGSGNDVLTGGTWGNVLDGGRGDDRLAGGMRDDTLLGGPGNDVLAGGPGKDTIYARDGARDVVDCGTNGPLNPERPDVAYVDRRDVVTRCERVDRR
jgi:RTX calcium-binding nonapeptide repeat (4 copies)